MNSTEKMNKLLAKTFATIAQADDMKFDYANILSIIPKNVWIRCSDIKSPYTTQKVSALMTRLVEAGYAERKCFKGTIVGPAKYGNGFSVPCASATVTMSLYRVFPLD